MILSQVSERAPPPTASALAKSVPASSQRRAGSRRRRRRRPPSPPGSGRARSWVWREADEGAAGGGVVVRRALAGEVGQEGDVGGRRRPGRPRRRARPACGRRCARAIRGCRRPRGSRPSGARCRGWRGRRRAPRPPVFGEKAAFETKSTPEVPSETKAEPGVTTPTPQAAAALSPAPPATTTGAADAPAARRGSGRRSPEGALPSTRRGIWARVRPVASSRSSDQSRAGDVEPERAGGVGHLRDVVAGQAEADVVLGQQHRVDVLEDLRLVLAQPGELRRGEAGHGDVAGDLARAREGGLDLGAFGLARPSFQRIAGRSTRSSWSRQTAPCIWPERPMPRRSASVVLAGERVDRRLDGVATRPPGPARTSRDAGAATVERLAGLADRAAGRGRTAPP